MKRAVILGMLFFLTAIAAPAPDLDFYAKLARFHDHYNRFMRAYMGCPKSAIFLSDCAPDLGTFDFSEFNHAVKAAAPLFHLAPKKE